MNKKAKILIVEDSEVSVELLRGVLEKEDYEIVVSRDGKDIKKLTRKHNIDIVLLDIILPEVSGFDLLQILVESDETKDIPVVIVSNLTAGLDVKKALDMGAMDFVRKTSEPIEIIARVHSALRLKEKQDQLIRMSQRDSLTQLYNKQYFNKALEKIIREKGKYHKGISLIMIDCDHFKNINDRYGHTFGDTVLSAVANAITKSIKQRDVACRFGGEEFCIIIPNATSFQAYAIAERLRTNIGKISFKHNDEIISVTVSCGVSRIKRDGEKESAQLVNESDIALYEAKQQGRNQTVLFADMRQETEEDE